MDRVIHREEAELDEHPVVSPPWLAQPYRCATVVQVFGFVPQAEVQLDTTASLWRPRRVNGCAQPQGVDVNPGYGLNKEVRAWFELCGDPSPPSQRQLTQAGPSPLPPPAFRRIYETGTQVVVNDVVNGATVALSLNGMPVGTFRCWGGSLLVGGLGPLADTDTFSATQELCLGSGSLPGTTSVQPCSALPAPTVAPIQAGDFSVTVTDFEPDAVIRVWVNRRPSGAGGGPTVGLTTGPLSMGDMVVVAQDLPGGCRGTTAWHQPLLPAVAPIRRRSQLRWSTRRSST